MSTYGYDEQTDAVQRAVGRKPQTTPPAVA
jgi:hypothetical protein